MGKSTKLQRQQCKKEKPLVLADLRISQTSL